MKIHAWGMMAVVLVAGAAAGLGSGCSAAPATNGSGGSGGGAASASATSSSSASSSTSASASSSSASSSSASSSSASSTSASSSSTSSTSASSTSASSTSASSSSGGQNNAPGIDFTGLDYTTQYGNPNGGQAYEDACPAGQVIIGYQGFLHPNGYHGQLQAQCGIPAVSGNAAPFAITITSGALTPLEGAQGVPPAWALTCPADQVVVGFSGRSGGLLDFLSVSCAPLSITGAPGNYAVTIGAVTAVPGVGDQGGSAFPYTPCPAGEVATENHLRAGDGIDYFGMGCSKAVVVP